jgi:hypothetical protein
MRVCVRMRACVRLRVRAHTSTERNNHTTAERGATR